MNAIKDLESAIKQQKLGPTSVGENKEVKTKVNGFIEVSPQEEINNNSNGVYHLLKSSSQSHPPARKEGEYDLRSPTSETISNNLWKQDLAIKVRKQGEDISKLKKHLSDYSIKESQLQKEKNALEKRIAHMHMAFVQEQRELIEAQSRALSYRQDIIEENAQLTYSLQSVQQERTTFLSTLVPPLSEYNLRPSTMDARSIVYNLKLLLKQLQEKLILNEEKLKELNCIPPQPPPYSFDGAIFNQKKGLDIVPQPAYTHAKPPAFPSSVGLERMSPHFNRLMEDGAQRM